jgi:hypothetical protein
VKTASAKNRSKGSASKAKAVAGSSKRHVVALAVAKALARKPRVNPQLLAMFRANRDLLTP